MNATQQAELQRLKQYFPFRIVFGAIKGNDFECSAVATMHRPNKLVREGWTVYVLK